MIATVRKVHPNRYSRNGNIYTRIEFMTDDGSWYKTDVCPIYRNYSRWVPVIELGVGTVLEGLTIRKGSEVNGDSIIHIIGKPPEMVGKAPEVVVSNVKPLNQVQEQLF